MVTSPPAVLPCLVRAIYSWSGEEKKDLGFVEGDIIEVINTGDGNWWTGRLKRNKVIGLFPCNFVEYVERTASPAPTTNAGLTSGQPSFENSVTDLSISSGIGNTGIDSTYNLDFNLSKDDILDDIRKALSRTNSGYSFAGTSEDISNIVDPRDNQRYDELDSDNLNISGNENDLESYLDAYYDLVSPDTAILSDDDDDDDDNDLSDASTSAPPPLPPPHVIPTSSLNSSVSSSQTPSTPRNQSINTSQSLMDFDRTPSPVRNAMQDLLESLDGMSFSTVSGSKPVPFQSEYQSESSVTTSTPAVYSTLASKSDNKLHSGSFFETAALPLHKAKSFSYSLQKPNELSDEDDEDDIRYQPFDSNSYASFLNHSTPERRPDHLMARADTFQSTSSANTASLSIASHSTTPTSISNFSATSAGSLARRKREATVGNNTSPLGMKLNPLETETPVNLPTDNPTPSKPRISLHKSTGFLRKLFRNGQEGDSKTPEKVTAENSPNGFSVNRSVYSSSISSRVRRTSKSFTKSAISHLDLKPVKSTPNSNISPQSEQDDPSRWIEIRRDVHRATTLTRNERENRKLRLQMQGLPVLEPIQALNMVQGDETINGPTKGHGKHDPRSQDLGHVDRLMASINSWSQFSTPESLAKSLIAQKFPNYQLEMLRAVFDFCATKFAWEELSIDEDDHDENELADDYEREGRQSLSGTVTGSLSVSSHSHNMLHSRRANPYEIASCVKRQCNALGIQCELVKGHLKSWGEFDYATGLPVYNHCWNAVIIEGEWRMIDASLANPSFPTRHQYTMCPKDIPEYFYFLSKPSELIYTHVPYILTQQHIIPPLSPQNALALPIACHSSFDNYLRLVNYSNGVSRLENFEVAELVVAVPHDVELLAEVKQGAGGRGEFNGQIATKASTFGLAQAFWQESRRYYRVKAILPPDCLQGCLNIYVGKRGTLKSIQSNVLDLAYSIPLTHKGHNAPYNFVVRHPTPHCTRQDIYISQPQCQNLARGNNYVFSFRQHPCTATDSGLVRLKIAIQSPSGRITKLAKKEVETTPVTMAGTTYERAIKCLEVGPWRGLILSDRANSWSVFSEWRCE